MSGEFLLNGVLWTPVLGAIAVLGVPGGRAGAVRWAALASTAATLLLALLLYVRFDASEPGVQFLHRVPWIGHFHIFYALGVDGVSLPMVLLSALLFLLCVPASWTVEKSPKAYFALFLMLESAVMGVFLALDFFLFFLYWEVMLLPMFFLIGVWGGESKEYAAVKFFLYTFFGSVLMLVGIVALYFATGQGEDSFDIIAMHGGRFAGLGLDLFGWRVPFAEFVFVLLFVGLAIKVPLVPFHTWLPHAHVQAPTAVSVILAGVLLKMGTYGFLRLAFPIFPDAAARFADAIAWLGLVNIVYGALCAMAQDDMKKLVAYSSVSHMGFVMVGMAAMTVQGMNGAVLQMFNHGTSTAMMFLLIGILYERSHHRWIVRPDGTRGFGGLSTRLPRYTVVFILAMFASMGLPGLSGFISEALILLGIYGKYPEITVVSLLGLLLGAAYLLWMFRRMFFGEVPESCAGYADMNARETALMAPLCAAVVVFGVYPAPLLDVMRSSVGALVRLMAGGGH